MIRVGTFVCRYGEPIQERPTPVLYGQVTGEHPTLPGRLVVDNWVTKEAERWHNATILRSFNSCQGMMGFMVAVKAVHALADELGDSFEAAAAADRVVEKLLKNQL